MIAIFKYLNIEILKYTRRRAQHGVASLPAIILFGGIIIEIAVAGVLLIYYLNNSIYGNRLSNEALVAAQTGLEDATIKVILDKSCPNATCPSSYSLTVGNASVDVAICKDTCQGAGKTEITATGRALTKRHKIIKVLSVNSTTGLITTDSVTEGAL